jgi:trans-2,3-dihydro-3-hydroxyanthranilate isomerase
VLEALGLPARPASFHAYDNGPQHLCIGVSEPGQLSQLSPDFSALARATALGVGVFHYDGTRCKVRYFVPAAGVNEDPATGSFAGPLALALQRAGKLPLDELLRIEQGAEIQRPSQLFARVGGGAEPRVEVGGAARVVARGQFVI